MLPTFFKNEHLHLLFFGGKGGVGKTSSAASAAVWLAGDQPAKKYLLISTDPAHSLFDSFELEKHEAGSMKQDNHASCFMHHASDVLPNLSIREFDATCALERFKKKYGSAIKSITDRGTYFDNADIDSFFNLSLPGIDEMMGIFEIAELLERHEYDTIIIDTAPTGHTLSMLRLPELLDKWLGVFDLMEGKHHLLQEHFARSRTTDNADDFLKTMHDRLKMVGQLLRNPQETEFVVVTIPEEMVVAETDRLLKALYELKIPVHNIIVNRISMNEGCPVCEKRKDSQQSLVERIEAKASYKKIYIPTLSTEVHGLKQLKLFASWIVGETKKQEARSRKQEAGNRKHEAGKVLSCIMHHASCFLHHASSRLSLSALDHIQFIMVCGKGGVGKTTVASSTAVLLAERQPEIKYQLYSIDPANSLGDSFSMAIGDKGINVLPNLAVYELDAQKLYQKFQDEYQTAIDELFDRFVGGVSRNSGIDFGYDRELLKELLATSPPGLEELMALHEVISKLTGERGSGFASPSERGMGGRSESAKRVVPTIIDCVILDTAPTGHFVRFLELPELVKSWLKAIFELLLKYKGMVQLNEVAEKLVSLSRNIRLVMDVITDKKRSCAVAVTIPEAMSIAETRRLINAIDDHKIRCAGVVVNMATNGSPNCDFCASRVVTEAEWIKEANGLCKDTAVVPYTLMDIRGIEKLAEFGEMVWK